MYSFCGTNEDEYDSGGRSEGKAKVFGFPNLGGTCYLNSTLQALLYCNDVYAKLTEHSESLICERLVALKTKRPSEYALRSLISSLHDRRPDFDFYKWQDPFNFFGVLMNVLPKSVTDLFAIKTEITEFLHGQPSPPIITQRFQVQLAVSGYHLNVQDTLDEVVKRSASQKAPKLPQQVRFLSAPHLLVVFLNAPLGQSFSISNFEQVDVSELFRSSVPLRYQLRSVVQYNSYQYKGHAWAAVKTQNGKWYECNDSSVNALHSLSIYGSARLLFYEPVVPETPSPPPQTHLVVPPPSFEASTAKSDPAVPSASTVSATIEHATAAVANTAPVAAEGASTGNVPINAPASPLLTANVHVPEANDPTPSMSPSATVHPSPISISSSSYHQRTVTTASTFKDELYGGVEVPPADPMATDIDRVLTLDQPSQPTPSNTVADSSHRVHQTHTVPGYDVFPLVKVPQPAARNEPAIGMSLVPSHHEQRFIDSCKALSALHHRSLTTVQHKPAAFLYGSDFVPLSHFVAHSAHRFSVPNSHTALQILHQVVRGLLYLEEHEFACDDLQPSNIMISTSADHGVQVKLLHFYLPHQAAQYDMMSLYSSLNLSGFHPLSSYGNGSNELALVTLQCYVVQRMLSVVPS